jgi:hypothetical protein
LLEIPLQPKPKPPNPEPKIPSLRNLQKSLPKVFLVIQALRQLRTLANVQIRKL